MILLLLFSLLNPSLQADQKDSSRSFHEITRFQPGGDGGWDYMTFDPLSKKLYVARFNRVMVIDSDSGKQIGEVSGVEGAHGTALVPKLNLGFATAGKAGAVIVFNLKTMKVEGHISVGENPDAILYDPASKNIFVFNGKSHSASVIDPSSKKVLATIPLSGKPEFGASDEAGKVFVNIEDQNTITEIDTRKQSVARQFPLSPCEEPTGLSMDPLTHHLFVGCGNKMAAIVDSETGKVLTTFPAGDGIDATAFDSQHKLIFVSAGEGKLSVIQETNKGFELVQTLETQRGARTLAVDPVSQRIFLATAQFGPPEPAQPGQKQRRPAMIPGTFVVLVMGL